jgi:glycosyltransferase involved in cell wall biosynthesis
MVLDSDYPSETNLYGDVFVHTRAKAYQQKAEVFVVSFFRDWTDYEYEGVKVRHAPQVGDLFRIANEFRPDVIFIHFYHRRLFDFIKAIGKPTVIWVHGYEALGWYRRLFNYTSYQVVRHIHSLVLPNLKQMIGFRRIVRFSNAGNNIRFIFVSKWMKKIAETDSATKVERSGIVPNPIDTDLFKYQQKTAEQRRSILMIRSFGSKKYANDIAVEAIKLLSRKEFFKDLQFSIYGAGKYFAPLTDPLKSFENVTLNEGFIPNGDIPHMHAAHGVFLCPTRQDAQGVSMCEAMSSGLVPVTTDCTAIPEFVEHNRTGVLARDASGLAMQIERLYNDPGLFLELSENAAAFIREKCSFDTVVSAELALAGIEPTTGIIPNTCE